MIKRNPKFLVAVLIICGLFALAGPAAIGYGVAMFYNQRQMNEILMKSQASESAHSLELKNARLEERATCEARISIATGNTQQMKDDMAAMKSQNEILTRSLDRLTKLSEARARTGDAISRKVDTIAKKVDQVNDSPSALKPTTDLNRKIEDANRKINK